MLLLDDAVHLAVENSRLVSVARLDVDKASAELAALTTRRRPNVDVRVLGGSLLAPLNLTFPMGAFGTFPSTGPIPFADTSVTTDPTVVGFLTANIAQPLTQLKTIGWGQKALNAGRDVAKEQVRAQAQTVGNNVRKVYYGLLQAQSGLAANAEALALYRELERLVTQYVDQQVALPGDLLQIKTALARQEQTDVSLRNTQATLKEQMNLLLGRDIATDFSIGPGPSGLDFSATLAEAEAAAVAQRPEVRQARLRLQQAQFDAERTRSAARPEISLMFTYFGFYNAVVVPTNVAAAGVYGSWEPWDWGRRRQEQAVKARVVDQAQLAVREAEDSVRVDVRMNLRKVQEARAALDVADLGRQSAREALRVALDRVRAEASLQRQVLEAQAASAGAEQQYQQALAAFWTARADFDKATGGEP